VFGQSEEAIDENRDLLLIVALLIYGSGVKMLQLTRQIVWLILTNLLDLELSSPSVNLSPPRSGEGLSPFNRGLATNVKSQSLPVETRKLARGDKKLGVPTDRH
jgi:hypothetical protein